MANDIFLKDPKELKVWLSGIECQIRQEVSDDIYGTVSAVIPSRNGSSQAPPQIVNFPDGDPLQMGEPGTRTKKLEKLVYQGPPDDVVLASTLVNHDSGDISDYKKALGTYIKNASLLILGGASGVAAEKASEGANFVSKFVDDIVDWIADDLLGLGDDPFDPTMQRISAADLITVFRKAKGELPEKPNPFPFRQMTRADTPGVTLNYNLDPVIVTGVDDDGDIGKYAFYYKLELFDSGVKVLGDPS
ncbi:hypothetical protein [Nocardia asiatica]